MARNVPRAKRRTTRSTQPRIARTVRMSADEAKQVEKLRTLRNLTTQQPVLHDALSRGLRMELAEQGVALYRGGRTLAEAAAEIGMPLSELFDYCVQHDVTLIQNPNFFAHMAALGRSLKLPALTTAAERLARE